MLAAIDNSIGFPYNNDIHDVLVTGDFNLVKNSIPAETYYAICQYYGLEQLPTMRNPPMHNQLISDIV